MPVTDVNAMIDIVKPFIPLVAVLIAPILSFTKMDATSNFMRKRVNKFIFSCSSFRKFLDLDKIVEEDKQYAKRVSVSLIAPSTFLVVSYLIGTLQSVAALMLLITMVSLLMHFALELLLSLKDSKYFVTLYKNYRIFTYSIMLVGVLSSAITYSSSPVSYILLAMVFYTPAILDYLTFNVIAHSERASIEERLKDVKKSPTVKVLVNNKKISGKIKRLFNKDFFIINRANGYSVMVLWDDVKSIECQD